MMTTPEKLDHMLLPGETSGLELEYPERLAKPSAWLGHVPFAMWLVGALKPRMIVELGVHTGNSYCAFLQAVRTLGLDTPCFGIDHWRGDEHAGLYDEGIYHEFRAYHDARYGTFSTLLRSSFDEARSYFSDGSIDLLHIDGFHTFKAVSADFNSWLPKVSSRGIGLFHDINVRERGFGIWQFWKEICARYPNFEFIHSHGLGIAYLGSEPLTGPLEVLFAAKPDAESDRVRSYFARLGTSIVERRTAQTIAADLDAVNARVTALEEELEAARSVLAAQEQAKGQLVELRTELHAARHEAARANTNAEAFAYELEAARLELITAKSSADALAKDLKLTLQAQTLSSSLARERIEVAGRLQRDLIAANVDKLSYQRQLQQVLHSTSWRLTGPIRQAITRLKRFLASDRQAFGRTTVPPS